MFSLAAVSAAQSVGEQLLFQRRAAVRAQEFGLVIIKPCIDVPNANNSPQNINSIAGRFACAGWQAEGLKVIDGQTLDENRIVAHYPKSFADNVHPDVQPRLNDTERVKLETIWGPQASSLPIYHATQLAVSGRMTYEEISQRWHAGRGVNNALLDAGTPDGVNNITPQADPVYGKRRILKTADKDGTFFILNGFTAEMMIKFKQTGEKIVTMLLSQEEGGLPLSDVREHVVGATVPNRAEPGSIRYDALHAESYTGSYPIISLGAVGVENNIVHFSDSIAEAARETQLWMPEFHCDTIT
jgi:nucleoside diphosphate kinase